MRAAIAVVLLLGLAAAAPGCGGTDGETRLRLDTERWDEAAHDVVPVHLRLTCDPPGGTLPDPEQACNALEAHREMTDPPELTGTCAGDVGIPPNVSVTGVFHGRRIDVVVRSCDAPPPRGEAARLWLVAAGLVDEASQR